MKFTMNEVHLLEDGVVAVGSAVAPVVFLPLAPMSVVVLVIVEPPAIIVTAVEISSHRNSFHC